MNSSFCINIFTPPHVHIHTLAFLFTQFGFPLPSHPAALYVIKQPPLSANCWTSTQHTSLMRMSEWLKGRTAQGHAIPRWAGCQWKRGLFLTALLFPMAGSRDVRDAPSCHCIATSRTETRGASIHTKHDARWCTSAVTANGELRELHNPLRKKKTETTDPHRKFSPPSDVQSSWKMWLHVEI